MIVIAVPTLPLAGLKLSSCGVTRNIWLLFNVLVKVVTVTDPVSAPGGTVAVKYVSATFLNVAATPSK